MAQQVWLLTVPVKGDAKSEFKKVHDGAGHGNGQCSSSPRALCN